MLKICEKYSQPTHHKLCAVTETCHYGNYSKFCYFLNKISFARLHISVDLLIFKVIGSIREGPLKYTYSITNDFWQKSEFIVLNNSIIQL